MMIGRDESLIVSGCVTIGDKVMSEPRKLKKCNPAFRESL